MTDIAISVREVSKCYRVFDDQRSRLLHAVWPGHTRGMREVWALKGINFEIKRGEAVAIIGRNGGGKSTLLEILTGTLMPSEGEVTVNGRVSALLELGSGFNPEYSGRDNVILNGLLLGLQRSDILGRFAEIEAFAEIGAAIDRPVKTYSSGMVMRLAFAVQVLCDPDILIIDEALSVGDFFFQQKCLSYIRALCNRGTTLLFVSHDMGTVRDLCERGILLDKGSLRFDGGNLEAIRLYLQPNNDSAGAPGEPTAKTAELQGNTTFKCTSDYIWALEPKTRSLKLDKLAYITAVGIVDANGHPIASAKMGEEVTIRVHYVARCRKPLHVHLVLKNKYDQVVTAVGSFNIGLSPPILTSNQTAIFELNIQLSLEAGNYVLCATLALPSTNGLTGDIIDETPLIGPFQISWNYSAEVPPFFGLCGMNNACRFLTDAELIDRSGNGA